MTRNRRDTVIVGAGPVGLTTALFAARSGKVLVVAPACADKDETLRVDCVPVSLLLLFLELGLHPAELGIDDAHDARMVAWEHARPEIMTCATSVHVERPRLEKSLLRLARRHSSIEVRSDLTLEELPRQRFLFDATGRRAVSAEERVSSSEPMICRAFVAKGRFSKSQQALRVACTPSGYAYRLGAQASLTLGIVEDQPTAKEGRCSPIERLEQLGASWLGFDLLAADISPGKGGPASVQWAAGCGSMVRIGDAAFARDALASQGIANGISHGLHVLQNRDRPAEHSNKLKTEIESHLKTLNSLIGSCLHRYSPSWQRYGEALGAMKQRIALSISALTIGETSDTR